MAAPYPARRDGERMRWLPFPCERPEAAQAERVTATRRDGSACDVRRTLGLGPAPGDDGVHDWRPVA